MEQAFTKKETKAIKLITQKLKTIEYTAVSTDEKPGIFCSIKGLIYCYPDFWWHIVPAEKPEMLHVTLAQKLTFMDKG